jgi:Fe-S cluster biosynthesis and repair protein YggX
LLTHKTYDWKRGSEKPCVSSTSILCWDEEWRIYENLPEQKGTFFMNHGKLALIKMEGKKMLHQNLPEQKGTFFMNHGKLALIKMEGKKMLHQNPRNSIVIILYFFCVV